MWKRRYVQFVQAVGYMACRHINAYLMAYVDSSRHLDQSNVDIDLLLLLQHIAHTYAGVLYSCMALLSPDCFFRSSDLSAWVKIPSRKTSLCFKLLLR